LKSTAIAATASIARVDAGHSVIYLGPDDLKPPDMEQPDVRRLEVLGWQWDIGHQCWRHVV
jgi:hypothetical protein